MESYFFRVDHDLLKSESFKALGGSAIKVYLIIGLYSDFGSGWAYPSIRTIARQAGLSRQTVLAAIKDLADRGMLVMSKSRGRSTAYRILRQGPEGVPRPQRGPVAKKPAQAGPITLDSGPQTGPLSLRVEGSTGQYSLPDLAQFFGPLGPADGPNRQITNRDNDNSSMPIPGTPFRITAEGRLLVSVDLQELLTSQGLAPRLASKLATQRAPEDVAKVLLNALYLQSQGKLQNGPGYIRAALESGYELLPQVASRLESRRRELQEQVRSAARSRDQQQRQANRDAEEEAIRMVLDRLNEEELEELLDRAVASLPAPLVRRNPTLTNPFVRAKVYELVGGDPEA